MTFHEGNSMSHNKSSAGRCAAWWSCLLILLLAGTAAQAQTRGGFSVCDVTAAGDNQTVPVNTHTMPMSLTFSDGGSPISGIEVDVFVDQGQGRINGQSSSTVLLTDSTGTVSFDYLAGPNPGTDRIGAFSENCLSGGSYDFTVNVVPMQSNSIMPVQGNNSTGTLSLPLPQELIIEYLDSGGMPIAGRELNWSLSGDSQLGSPTTTTDSSGRASNTVILGLSPGVLLIDVIDPMGSSSSAFTFTINVAPPTVTFPENVAPLRVSLGGLSDPFTATVSDHLGHPMNGVEVSWMLAGSGSSSSTLVNSSTTTDSTGMSSNQLMAELDMTGDVLITASVFDMAASDQLNIQVVAPIIETLSGSGQTGLPGSTLDDLLVQLSLPPFSTALKSIESVPVSWTVLSGDALLGSQSSLSDANGVARMPITLGSMPGDSVIQASAPGMGSTQFTVTALSGPAPGSQFSAVSGNGQMTLPGQLTDDLVVQLVDPDGNPIPGVTINWAATPAATSTVTNETTVTDENGQSSNTARIFLPGAGQVIASIDGSTDIPAVAFSINSGVANSGGLRRRQAEVAGAIDAACPALFNSMNLDDRASDLLARCSEIVGGIGSDPVAVANVLDNLATEEAAAQGTVATETNVTQMRNVKSRMLALRSGQTGIDASGLVLQSGRDSLPVSAFSSFMQADEDSGGGASFGPWGFFINGRITTGDKDNTDTETGFDFNAYGLTAGVDYRVSNSFVLGAAIGYNDLDNDLNNNSGSLQINGYNLTGYATWYGENRYYLDTLLTWGNNDLDSERRISYTIPTGSGGTTVNQIAFGSPDSDTLGIAMSLGRDFSSANRIFSPYLRLDYTDIDIDGYSERLSNPNAAGAGLGLQVASQNIESLEAVLGARLSWSLSRSWGVFSPMINLEYAHEFDDDSRVIAASFLSDPTNTAFTVLTDDPDRDYFNLGVGASFVFSGGRSMFINYDTIIGLSDISQHTLRIGGRFEF